MRNHYKINIIEHLIRISLIFLLLKELDEPILLSFDEKSFSFTPPKSKNVKIEFYLIQLESHAKFIKKATYTFYYININMPQIYQISLNTTLSIGETYKIDYNVSKNFAKFGTRSLSGSFVSTLSISFPISYIFIIAMAGVFIILAPLIIFSVIKRRKKLIYVKQYVIKPDKLGLLLERWDQTQNSGCSKEWEALAAETEKNILENRPTTEVAREPENRKKNRYMDILPCKRTHNLNSSMRFTIH